MPIVDKCPVCKGSAFSLEKPCTCKLEIHRTEMIGVIPSPEADVASPYTVRVDGNEVSFTIRTRGELLRLWVQLRPIVSRLERLIESVSGGQLPYAAEPEEKPASDRPVIHIHELPTEQTILTRCFVPGCALPARPGLLTCETHAVDN